MKLDDWLAKREQARAAGEHHTWTIGAREAMDRAIEVALGPPPPADPPKGWMDSASTMHLSMWPSGQIVLVLRNEAPSDLRIIGDPEGMRDCIDRFIEHRAAGRRSDQ